MSDTPPPDIPDPASPSPASPEPARPRRVITRPDTMVGTRLPGAGAVTRPDSAKASRLPGTYAANYSDDPNWQRGALALWTLFGLAALLELFRALFIVWSGQDWPEVGDYARLGLEAMVFLVLWAGWSGVRWVLVAVDFAFGAWYIIRTIAPLPTDIMAAHPELRTAPGVGQLSQLALGIVYLVSAGYLAFSADVIGFTRHRREEGRGWIVVPIALLVAAYLALVCSLQPLSVKLFAAWQPAAGQFAIESLQAVSAHWDPAAYGQRADPEFLQTWPTWKKENRDPTFGTLAGLGPVQMPVDVNPSEGKPTSSPTGSGFLVKYHCDFGRVRCAHGSITLGFVVSRHMLGPWRLEELTALDPRFDPAPATTAPAPSTTPAPTVSPAP